MDTATSLPTEHNILIPVSLSGGVVSALPRLCVLDVSCNPQLTQEVDVGGFTALASSLSHAASVTTLQLHACGLTPDGLDALGRRSTVFCVCCFIRIEAHRLQRV